ncbi:MAG: STAS-like domain-containing protein [bacterium]|nr:STAS-like domain-containing protein [bacterium]
MTTIHLRSLTGDFAENKDTARDIRIDTLTPILARGEKVTIDFSGVSGATQSFIHALISELFRIHGSEVLSFISFKNCNPAIQKVITIVTEYMQEAE